MHMPRLRLNRALLALTAAGVIWGLTVPLTKLALGWLDPAWLTVARFGLAAPVLAWIARRHLRAAFTPAIAAWGAAGFGMVVVLQNVGIERTSVSHAALIIGAVPALVAIISAACGRGTSGPVAWVGFAVALGGVSLVAGSGSGANSSASGDLLVLASAALAAGFIVAQKPLLEGRNAIAVTAVQMAAAAAAALPVALIAGSGPTSAPTTTALSAFLLLATVGSLLPFALYAYGQRSVTAEVAGAFVNLEPLIGATLGALAFGDAVGPVQLLGGLAILGGIGLSLVRTPPMRAAPAPA